MTQPAIETHDLGKRYRIGAPVVESKGVGQAVKNALLSPFAYLRRATTKGSELEWIWALKNADLKVDYGEAIGVIGRNGAGKTTLLKVLSRITDPTEGEAIVRGRVGSLLEVGTGFHPELTGRENVFLNGAIIGMRRTEIKAKFDEIVSFAEVAKFIDTPVKYYSSGMYVRLAFAVAAHLEPEIMLVDEVLAVGDAGFQKKCLGKMDDVSHQGRTVLLVSHNMEAVLGLCERAVWLDDGTIRMDGPAKEVVRAYVSESLQEAGERNLLEDTQREGDGRIRFTGFSLRGSDDEPLDAAVCGADTNLVFSFQTQGQGISQVGIRIWIRDVMGKELACLWTKVKGQNFDELPYQGKIVCKVPRLNLAPGTYSLDFIAEIGRTKADKIFNAARLEVVPGDFFGTGHRVTNFGQFLMDQSWSVEEDK